MDDPRTPPHRDEAGDEQERRLQKEREKAHPSEHAAAAGPGYTARPTDEEAEPGRG